MSTDSSAMLEPALRAEAVAQTAVSAPRRFYWSVRRELWEYRSIVIAPLAAAGVILFGVLLGTAHQSQTFHLISSLPPARQRVLFALPYIIAEAAIVTTASIVAFFYCLGALHNERRERSILFWKSLPVSDLTTVLAKVSIPLLVLPVVVFPIIVVTQIIMRALSLAFLGLHGLSTTLLTTQVPLFPMWIVTLYVLIVLVLWYAPIWAWLLLVSGWSRRMAFLWAVLPPLALCVIEAIAFNTSYFGSLLMNRLAGGIDESVDGVAKGRMFNVAQLDPVKFVSSPGLWIGLVVAAAFLATAVWLRRYRDPI
jgi:ABC-2 type transport system permease protein